MALRPWSRGRAESLPDRLANPVPIGDVAVHDLTDALLKVSQNLQTCALASSCARSWPEVTTLSACDLRHNRVQIVALGLPRSHLVRDLRESVCRATEFSGGSVGVDEVLGVVSQRQSPK